MRSHIKFSGALFLVLAFSIVLSIGVWFAIDKTVDRVVAQEAEASASRWASFFYEHLEDLEGLIASGQPNKHQAQTIQNGVDFGEVFRFKLFRPDGTIAVVSDEPRFIAEGRFLSQTNAKALEVYKTGISNTSIHNGKEKPNRPDLYVESYVPVNNASGETIGVVEVYVDQTEFASTLRAISSWLTISLPFLCAFIYFIPSIISLQNSALATAARAEAEHLSNFDGLTSLRNRRSFTEMVNPLFEQPTESDSTVGIIYIDIDDFKQINDEFGHDGGDAFLRWTAYVIHKELGEDAFSSRFGGDEFVACLPNTSREALADCAQRIMDRVAKGTRHRDKTVTGKISVGICYAPTSETLVDVLHAADLALYKSKAAGKNTVTCYTTDMKSELRRRQKLEALLRRAVDGTGLVLNYQPINEPVTNKILGFEALLRLQDSNGAIVQPMEFIPLAEDLHLISPIGKWVLEEAISNAVNWPDHMFVSVNLSAIQFEANDLVGFIADVLKKHQFPAHRLELEVTESLLMGDDGNTQKQIEAIKELGVSVAMDDFGTGYSSLGYLWKYNFNKLKIDRSFLLGHNNDPKKLENIIETIVNLGQKIGMVVTVEGVENRTQVNMLSGMGCDQLQGFYFGKPMSPLDVSSLIAKETLQSLSDDEQMRTDAKADAA